MRQNVIREFVILGSIIGLTSLAACGSLPSATKTAEPAVQANSTNTSSKIADNGAYGTFLDTHVVDGKTVKCLVFVNSQGIGGSCDWSAK